MRLSNCKVVILMATYQGEKYIREQLESIISQDFTNWELYISDDGSNDDTLKILQEYKKSEQRIIEIIHNNGEHGAFANFFNLMRYVHDKINKKYDFYFYCDQDDIWCANKIEKQLECMLAYKNNVNSTVPLLCYSDLQLIDGQGNMLGYTLGANSNIELTNPYNIFFAERYIWGTTMAHDNLLWDMLKIPNNIPRVLSHDNFVGRYAASFGKIIFIKEPLVLYRRHGGNVTNGIPHGYTLWQGIKRIFTKMPEVLNNHGGTYWASLYFISHVAVKNKAIIDIERCLKKGGITGIRLAMKYHINTANNIFNRIAFFIILGTGVYKYSKKFHGDYRC